MNSETTPEAKAIMTKNNQSFGVSMAKLLMLPLRMFQISKKTKATPKRKAVITLKLTEFKTYLPKTVEAPHSKAASRARPTPTKLGLKCSPTNTLGRKPAKEIK